MFANCPNILISSGVNPGLGGVLCTVHSVISLMLPIVMVLALLYFFWGLANYILAAGDDGSKEKGKNIMIWGVVAFFVMVSIWGLVGILQYTFGTKDTGTLAPTISLPKG